MDREQTINQQVETLKTLLASKLGLRRGSLSERIKRAGRRLPSGVQRDLHLVAQAENLAQNPKMAQRLNPVDTRAAYVRAEIFLKSIDVKDRRKGILLGLAGSVAFNILAVLALLIVVLRWRGFV